MGFESSGITPEWNKTVRVQERIRDNTSFYEEPAIDARYGKFQGRSIIGRDVPINGGVYLGGGNREAIVVDDEKYSQELDTAYYQLIQRRKEEMERTGKNFKDGILSTVFETTKEILPYDEKKVQKISEELHLENDKKISLNYYINARAGVCRHQALLGSYLLERLKKEGFLTGNVSIDRNAVPNVGGHAWIRYTNSAGEVFIIDPAQNYIGNLKSIPQNRWFYERPEDVKNAKDR